MSKKPLRETLPKDLDALFEAAATSGDDAALRAAPDACQPNATSGTSAYTALMNRRCTPELARWLVARGADVSAAAERFEFHRAGFARDWVEATSAACAALRTRFGVEPPPARVMHDGRSPIVASGPTWQKRHEGLWQLLVGSSGACATVQGEVVRITGRVLDELRRNGGGNWDRDYDAMVEALAEHLASANALSPRGVARAAGGSAHGAA